MSTKACFKILPENSYLRHRSSCMGMQADICSMHIVKGCHFRHFFCIETLTKVFKEFIHLIDFPGVFTGETFSLPLQQTPQNRATLKVYNFLQRSKLFCVRVDHS